jgi:hypothetical protein
MALSGLMLRRTLPHLYKLANVKRRAGSPAL